ncbi:MAG: hypothetical protein ACKOE6_05835 [Flammeovirgaceae bacterium]
MKIHALCATLKPLGIPLSPNPSPEGEGSAFETTQGTSCAQLSGERMGSGNFSASSIASRRGRFDWDAQLSHSPVREALCDNQ